MLKVLGGVVPTFGCMHERPSFGGTAAMYVSECCSLYFAKNIGVFTYALDVKTNLAAGNVSKTSLHIAC